MDPFLLPSTGEWVWDSLSRKRWLAEHQRSVSQSGGAPDALGDGQLGIKVRRRTTLAATFINLLTEGQVPSELLSQAVHDRFGAASFKAGMPSTHGAHA